MAAVNIPLAASQVARIAVYDDLLSAPRIVDIQPADIRTYIEQIASTTYDLATKQGGSIPYTVIREVSENFIHANFMEPTVSILDRGNTIRFADQGPGIENKDRVQIPGFTSATSEMKDYIRGVGSGLPIVKEYLRFSNGRLVIEDNIKDGTVITITVDRTSPQNPVVYQELNPSYAQPWQQQPSPRQTQTVQQATKKPQSLSMRDKDVLALATEGSIGPTDIKNSLGISVATAYRILEKLEGIELLGADPQKSGKRVITDKGIQALKEQV